MTSCLIAYLLPILIIAGILLVLFIPSNNWSDWSACVRDGAPGFFRIRFLGVKNQWEKMNAGYLGLEEDFVPLTKFVGRDNKPLTMEQWQRMIDFKLNYHMRKNFGKKLKKRQLADNLN